MAVHMVYLRKEANNKEQLAPVPQRRGFAAGCS